MWRPIVAAVLFLTTLSCGIFMLSRTNDISGELAQEVPLSISESAQSQLDLCYDGFNKNRNLFSTLFVHEAVDEIADSFERSFVLLGEENDSGYTEEASHLKQLLLRLPARDEPSIENIF